MIFLNASGGGVPQSEKWLCEQPSNHNYTQMRLREEGNVGIFLVDQDQPFLFPFKISFIMASPRFNLLA